MDQSPALWFSSVPNMRKSTDGTRAGPEAGTTNNIQLHLSGPQRLMGDIVVVVIVAWRGTLCMENVLYVNQTCSLWESRWGGRWYTVKRKSDEGRDEQSLIFTELVTNNEELRSSRWIKTSRRVYGVSTEANGEFSSWRWSRSKLSGHPESGTGQGIRPPLANVTLTNVSSPANKH